MATGGLASTNCFLLADESTKQAVIFDAPDHTVQPLLDLADKNEWRIIGLWLTHGHFDHLADHAVVTAHSPGAKVLIHALDHPKLKKPGSAMFQLPFKIPPRDADALIADGDVLKMGRYECKVIHTPGHSPGHVCFHFESEGVLIGGDLIICGAVGRTSLPGSSTADLDDSIRTVMELPPSTKLLPGHCDATSLGDELRDNAYVRAVVSRPLV